MIQRIMNSIAVKVGTIGILVLLLLIPASMVTSLIKERRSRKWEAVNDISSKWGGVQVVAGPIITIPYKTVHINQQGKPCTINHSFHILPEDLNITGELIPEIRYRGIYKTVLYVAHLKINGCFDTDRHKIEEQLNNVETIEWDKATITIGVTDMRGIREAVQMTIDKQEIAMGPGSDATSITPSGMKSRINLSEKITQLHFKTEIHLNGSHDISFLPLGKTTSVKLNSKWDAPSFSGAYLPLEHNISSTGFSADWKIFEFNRNYPQMFSNDNIDITPSAFGVRLFIENDIYNQAIRTVKYAILFIIFTFTSIFLSDVVSKSKAHPFQYLLIGSAVTIFYVLLISLSEHINFGLAYLISSTAVVSMIFTYIKYIFNKLVMPIIIATIQIVLYLYFYVTLQSEDYALLMGSLGLFTVLAIVMYVTRKINWHTMKTDG